MTEAISGYMLPVTTQIMVLGVILLLCTRGAADVQGQITTHTALPVAKGVGILRIQTKFLRSTGDTSALKNRELNVVMVPLVVVYGVTSKLAAFVIAPIVDKRLEFDGPSGRTSIGTSGLADATLFLRYTVYQKDTRGATFRIAPFGGVKIPSGSTNASDDTIGLLPRPLQTGSGAWSPLIGAVVTRQTFAWQVDASVSYQFSGTSDAFSFGDEARFDVAAKIRLLPRELGSALPSFVYVNLESNLIWRGQNEMSGIQNESTGGMIWYLDPGLQYITRRFIIESAIQIPIVQDLNGGGLDNDFIFIVSLRIAF